MGVKLGSLFPSEQISFKDLHDRIIVIDAYNVLHQFLATIRQRDGTALKNADGKITSHLSGLFYRSANLVQNKIKPVYVFDGKPHELKQETIDERNRRRLQAEKDWKDALEKGDTAKARVKAQQTSRVTDEIVEQSKTLLEILGIPYVQAPEEGEAQASYMVRKGDAYGVGSQDFDCLLIGSPVLIRNLTSSSKRKLPGKKAYVKVHPERIYLNQTLDKLGISQKQLVDMAILMGTDFNEGIKGIGPKKSLKLIKKNGNIENVISTIGSDEAPTFEKIKKIRSMFLNPKTTDDYELSWSQPDEQKLVYFLSEKYQFSEKRIESMLKKFEPIKEMKKQQTLF
ncbi:MAG: flap endonuclease-1 [Candidatus Thermoplasmatota archaeon]|nr:flap endonuclease-1 [Candidatus Thermoplasmatota archaeon]